MNRKLYQESQIGKKELKLTSLIFLVISALALVGGVLLIVFGALSNNTTSLVLMIVFGCIATLLGLTGLAFSLTTLFVSVAMIDTNGSVKDGNRAKVGTENIVKCDKCGAENDDNALYCSKCGTVIKGKIVCECGKVNSAEDEFCSACGKNLKEE